MRKLAGAIAVTKPIFETAEAPDKLTVSWKPQNAGPLHIRLDQFRDNGHAEISLSLADASKLAVALVQFLPGTYGAKPAPSDEPRAGWDCGNRALAARRVLRIIEANHATNWSAEAIATLEDLCDQAGPIDCGQALELDNVPF